MGTADLPLADAPPRVLLFIGSPRTGSTMLGQLLNLHPNCLIANEARFLTQLLGGRGGFDDLLGQVRARAWAQFRSGLEHDAHFAESLHRYQPRWVGTAPLADHPACAKGAIRVVGDKKAGGNTQAIIAHPEEAGALMGQHPEIALLQIMRHPVEAARSYMRSHGVARFDEALATIVHLTVHAGRWGRRFDDRYHCLRYESLCADPAAHLRSLLTWLGQPCEPGWLDEIVSIVDAARPVECTVGERSALRKAAESVGDDGLLAAYL
ncbi:MAG: sulfotransferase [Phycisphaerales bacterium]|nr:sulfotransferase [Phycisphaerales bacterium]